MKGKHVFLFPLHLPIAHKAQYYPDAVTDTGKGSKAGKQIMTENIKEIIMPQETDDIVVSNVTRDDVDCIHEAIEAERIADYEKPGVVSKLGQTFLEAAWAVLGEDINAIIYTDEELVTMINELLSEEQRITQRTFERWKAKTKAEPKEGEEQELPDPIGEEFKRLMQRALILQKGYLFQRLRWDFESWQRWAWIIERKFDAWNIRVKQEVTGASGGPIETEEKGLKGFTLDQLRKALEVMPE